MARKNGGSDSEVLRQAQQIIDNWDRIAPALASMPDLDRATFIAHVEALKAAQRAADEAYARVRDAEARKRAARRMVDTALGRTPTSVRRPRSRKPSEDG